MNPSTPCITTILTDVLKKVLKQSLFVSTLSLSSFFGYAQCVAPYDQATALNWDYLDYFVYTGNYTSANGYLPSNALARTQNFAFGTQRLTISHAFADAASLGENINHTGEAGSFGTGADINFNTNGTITFTFEQDVANLRFSIYDVDQSQSATVTALNFAGTSQLVTMTKTNAASALVIVGSGTISAGATSLLVGAQGNGSILASLNIDIAGPVNRVTITMGGTAGDFWISDISACTSGAFPTNYYAVSQPFTGQPAYVMHAFDKSVYAVNPANGVTKLLFTDAAGPGNVNSMSYDVYNHILYYVYSLTATPGTNKVLKKYDFNTETISTVVADLNTIGIPTSSTSGVESGAGAFYNGALYLGIETSNGSRSSARETIIWRLDFDASNIPYRASQTFAVPVDNGSGTLMHDWSDFVINDGILYDFDGAGVTTQTDIYHCNLLTGATINYPLPAGFTPGQPGVDWNGNLYNLHATTNAPAVAPYIAPYNGNGTIGTRINLTSTPMFTPAIPSLGDAGEAFKPKSDFGDAPASFTPVGVEPATHERIATLRLGSTYDYEWTGFSSPLADADGADEDGIGAAPTLNYDGTINYSIAVNVFNNTGSNATLVGWLDYDFDGIYDASEGVSVNVPNSAAAQLITIPWNNIWVQNTSLTNTFVRFRLTRAVNGMTTSNVNGYFPDGEVEDFPVVLGIALPKDIHSFKAEKTAASTVDVKWSMLPSLPVSNFEVLRSTDSKQWELIGTVQPNNASLITEYKFTDRNPFERTSYYRIRINYVNQANKFSSIEAVSIVNKKPFLKLSPNPANEHTVIQFNTEKSSAVTIELLDLRGRTVKNSKMWAQKGDNTITIDLKNLMPGIYTVRMSINDEKKNNKAYYWSSLSLLNKKYLKSKPQHYEAF